jgi:hypothetical protein
MQYHQVTCRWITGEEPTSMVVEPIVEPTAGTDDTSDEVPEVDSASKPLRQSIRKRHEMAVA